MYGFQQLGEIIEIMKKNLSSVTAPCLILQSSGDPIVNNKSAHIIYNGITSSHKELTLFSDQRHGVVNGQCSDRLFDMIDCFLSFTQSA
jgi:esterase/lipase